MRTFKLFVAAPLKVITNRSNILPTQNTKKETLVLVATILASGMAFLDGTVVNIAIPSIQSYFNTSFDNLLWVVNAFPLVLASFLLISGSLSDRFGRKKIFAIGILLFTSASFLCALSGSVLLLEIFRALQGLGAAMMIPGSLAIINVTIPQERRGRAIGLWSGFSGGIAAAGPFVGGWLIQHFSWHAIFFINIPLGITAFLLALFFVPESRNENAKKLDWWGTGVIFLSLFAVSYALISAPRLSWHNPGIISTFVGGIFGLILFYFIEKKSSDALVPFSIFKSQLVLGANLVTLFLYFALNGLIFFLVLNMQQIQNLSPTVAGLALLPAIGMITFLSGPGGSLADRVGPRVPMIVGPLIVSAGMALMILPGAHANYFTSFMPGLILFGLGMSLVIAPLTKSALNVEDHYAGAASGVNNAVARTAALLATAILGSIAILIFSSNLTSHLGQSQLSNEEQRVVLSQSDKLGGISVPESFSPESKAAARNSIEQSFVFSFRVVMGICVVLALISSALSFIFIRSATIK